MATGSFSIQVSGFAPARRDVELEIVSETTGETRRVKPFLDGSAMIRNLPTGNYAVKVLHPNVVGEIVDLKRIRLFEGLPTKVRLPLPEELFRDTPVRETVDADLSPVAGVAIASRDLVDGVGGKQPGDPIRSQDWNTLVQAVGDLAGAVAQLTQLVSPLGHDHPEIEEKMDEINGNARRFADSFARQLAQIQRTLQTLSVKRQADDVLGQATVVPDAVRQRLDGAFSVLESSASSDVVAFGIAKKNAYQQIFEALQDVRAAQEDPSILDTAESFQYVLSVATEESTASQPRSLIGEVAHAERINQKTGGSLYLKALGR